MENKLFSSTEKLLIAIAAIIFLVTGYVYVNDISLKSLLFPSAEDKILSTPIGRVVSIKGKALRQRAKEIEFRTLSVDAKLYPNDTLMTAAESTLSIELNDGKKVELPPNSLVKLSFGSDFSVTGIVRIDILQRGTEQVSATPTPKPEPLSVSGLYPPPNSSFQFSLEEFYARRKTIKISFKTNIKNARVTTHVFFVGLRSSSGGDSRRELSSIVPNIEGTNASATFQFNAPGFYEWEVRDTESNVLAKSSFELSRVVQVIKVHPVENANNRISGLATKKNFDGFTIKWQPIDGPANYNFKIYKGGSEKPIVQKEMHANELILNRNNLLLGRMLFSVEKEISGGFLATSGKQSFGFSFLPPDLTSPEPNAFINSARLAQTNRVIFFTWSKTNYTTSYEFELAEDRSFSKTITRRELKDNFVSLPPPHYTGQKTYFWRVRSETGGTWSDFSEPRQVTVSI